MSSGPNQHYIPRFVLRAFCYRKSPEETWFFERGETPKPQSIMRIASQNNFYSGPAPDGTPTLDDKIGCFENELAGILKKIRDSNPGEYADSEGVARVVTHLACRTANYRDCTANALVQALHLASDDIDNSPEHWQECWGIDQATINPRFIEHFWPAVIHGMPELSEIDLSTSLWGYILFHNAKEGFVEFREKGLFAAHAAQTEPDEWARDCHNQALSKRIGTNFRETFLEKLNWTIRDFPASNAILPDCVAFAVDGDANAIPYIFADQALIRAVVMPVSPDKHLIGSTVGYALPPTFDFNGEATRVSHNFFVSFRNDDETTRLHPLIGERVTAYWDEVLKDAIQAELSASSPAISGSGAEKPESLPHCHYSGFRECQLINKEVIQKIGHIALELSRVMPLERLDDITITEDYPKAIREIDREFENAPTAENGLCAGIAKMVLVKRAGEVKGHIIISAYFAQMLVSHIHEEVKLGTYIIARALALVAMIEIVERALPGAMFSAEESKSDDLLYACVDSALHRYVAARMASGFGDKHKLVQIKCELLIRSIGRMRKVISREKIAYRNHGDLHKFPHIALPCLEQVLTFSASLLGHIATLDEPLSHELDELYDVLDQAGLKGWLHEYQNDLESFYKRLGQWESFDEFLSFRVHVERLLRKVGIFPCESPEGFRVEDS